MDGPRSLRPRWIRSAFEVAKMAVDRCPANPKRAGDRGHGVLPGSVHLLRHQSAHPPPAVGARPACRPIWQAVVLNRLASTEGNP